MRALVVGPGAIGRLVVGRLAGAGRDVALLDHDAARTRQFSERGVQVMGPGGEERLFLPAYHTEEWDQGPRFDLLLCAVKAHHLGGALELAIRFLQPDGCVVVLSNGLGNLKRAEALWPENQCLVGTNTYGAVRVGETGVRATGSGLLRVGSRNCPDLAETIVGFLSTAFETEVVEDVDQAIWEKTAVNCAINPIATLLRAPNGALLAPDLARTCEAVVREVVAVAVANDVKLDVESVVARVEDVCRKTSGNLCSMLEDMKRRRGTEIDALCGEVVRRAKDVEVPLNRMLWSLIQAVEQ